MFIILELDLAVFGNEGSFSICIKLLRAFLCRSGIIEALKERILLSLVCHDLILKLIELAVHLLLLLLNADYILQLFVVVDIGNNLALEVYTHVNQLAKS